MLEGAAFLVVVLGVISSWTDRGDDVPLPFQVSAIALLAVGIVIAGVVLFGGKAQPGRADHA
ncbi:MAG TPA: hypothetical protein VEO91_03285 [Candidatus Limnocylindria bacterium]|nr:hypothetical protein [Candidatus Limnocylindria bacterium]